MAIIDKDLFFKIFPHDEFIIGEHVFTGGDDLNVVLTLSQTFHPETIIEIGIQRGGTAKGLLENGPWIKKYVGVDVLPASKVTLDMQQSEIPLRAGELVKDERLELILKADGSRDIRTTELPKADFIFVDGDHSRKGITHDTELARAIIKKGGIICYHDYNNAPVMDVTNYINELNQRENDRIIWVKDTWVCFEIR